MKIKDFSQKSLRMMFDKHIDLKAKVITDEWKSYKPIAKDLDITNIKKYGIEF